MTDLGPAVVAAIGAVGGTLAGGLVTGWVSLRSQTRADEAAEKQHEQQVDAERAAFQANTLLELQVAVQRELRAAMKIHHEDQMRHRTTGEPWGTGHIDDPVDQEAFTVGTVVVLLVGRVHDTELRDLVAALRAAIVASELGRSEQAATAELARATELAPRVFERIGVLLRELPAPSGPYVPMIAGPVMDTTEA